MIEVFLNNWHYLLFGLFPNGPLGGLALTIVLSLIGIGLAFPLGVLIAICCLAKWKVIQWPTVMFVYFMRGIPTLVLILFAYFVAPLLVGGRIDPAITLLAALVLYQAAYMAEIVRAGIVALPKGQVEAAQSLGLGYWNTLFSIVLPQALYDMLPSLLTQFISTIKETSLGYVISAQELTYVANQVNTILLIKPLEVFALLGLMYYVICFLLTRVVKLVEGKVGSAHQTYFI